MFLSYFKIAWRNLLKERQFAILNIIGLSTGLACAILVYLWVSDELHIDKFNEKDGRLYEVMKNSAYGGKINTREETPGLLAETLAGQMPDVEQAVAVYPWSLRQGILGTGEKNIKVNEHFAGKDFFTVFSYPLLQGDKDQVLTDKYAVVISEETALRLFNTTENLIGRPVQWKQGNSNDTYHITGIFKKLPGNSTDQFDIVFNYALLQQKRPELNEWFNGGCITYVVLKPGTDIVNFNRKIEGLLKAKTTGSQETLFVRRFSDKYLYEKYENGIQAGGRIEYIKLFSLIAIFILVIACINFMNLSTAKAFGRAKEVGIKKTMGADRGSLIFQYLGESALITFLALFVAIGLVFVLLPQFNTITEKHLALHASSGFVLAVLGITLFTSVVAGSYPALYLSGFNPIAVLKGKLNTTPAELLVRRGLVVFQFIMSVVLIVSVLVVYKQLSYIQTKNLGYSRDNIIMFKKDGRLAKDYESFITDVKKLPGVVNASNTWGNMTSGDNYTDDISWEGKSPNRSVQFADLQVNYDFIEMMGMHVKEGRSFSRNFGADSNNIILTEAAVATMGLQNPVGKTIRLWGKDRQIIGIVGNFYFESMYEKLKPCFLILLPIANNMMVKIGPGNEKQTINAIANLYHAYNPGLPFDFRFLDQDYQALYASEQRVAVLSRYFAGLAVIISCLGLFGLAAFTAQRKRKEISIRKVVGASVTNVVLILSRDFLKLVLIAILIAFPLAWWAMNRWLQDFAYRVQIGAEIFLIAGSLIILITLFAISFQAIKAALINPVKGLRSE